MNHWGSCFMRSTLSGESLGVRSCFMHSTHSGTLVRKSLGVYHRNCMVAGPAWNV